MDIRWGWGWIVLRALIGLMVLLVVLGSARAAAADGGYSADQVRVIGRIYQYAEFYGLTQADTELLLRVAYRETAFGVDRVGDDRLSVGVFQWHMGGVWRSTPCFAEYGWAGRWVEEADVACAAYAFNRGMQSHWRPDLHVRWLAVVPPDPRRISP